MGFRLRNDTSRFKWLLYSYAHLFDFLFNIFPTRLILLFLFLEFFFFSGFSFKTIKLPESIGPIDYKDRSFYPYYNVIRIITNKECVKETKFRCM